MGCHTWFYRKVEINYEECREEVLQYFNESIKNTKKFIYNRKSSKKVKWYLENYKYPIDKARRDLALYKRKKRIVYKGLCKEATMRFYSRIYGDKGIGAFLTYINGKGIFAFDNGKMPHDLFRIHNFPEYILCSLEETLKFIQDRKDGITYYHSTKTKTFDELIREFWGKYPDGIIKFG